jgi:NhaP-type Na+/H+ or K+/H+ antiporter
MSGLALFAVLVLVYTAVSKRLDGTVVSAALVFAVCGVAAGYAGAVHLDPVHVSGSSESLLLLAEIALALVLFADASILGLRRLGRDNALPDRLLMLGLPLTVAAGVAAGGILDGVGIWALVLIAALLAPTDAALAAPVVSDDRVPARVREALDVEAGLNDGICVPIVAFALSAAVGDAGSRHGLAHDMLVILGGGIVVGAVVGAAGARLLAFAIRRSTIVEDLEQIALAALAVAVFATAHALGASGFIAAFVGGLAAAGPLGDRRRRLVEFMEEDGHVLAYATFFVFGAVATNVLGDLTWTVAAYAALSLTAVRMLPVWICSARSGLRAPSVLFMGWFGPRGIASIALLLSAAADEPEMPGLATVVRVVVTTVLFSIVAHAVTAPPLVRRYGTWVARLPTDAIELAKRSRPRAARPVMRA